LTKHALRILEFDRIRDELLEYCMSEEGRSELELLGFITDVEKLASVRDAVVAYREFLQSSESFPALSFPPVSGAVEKLRLEGRVLEGTELASLAICTDSCKRWLEAIDAWEGRGRLSAYREGLPDMTSLGRRIARVIDSDGEIKEQAVPEIARVKRRIKDIRSRIAETAQRYLREDRSDTYASRVPSQRDGRTVLPVRANMKGRVPGIVHGASSTGSTLFVEPTEIVSANNELVEAEQEYRRELFRVLRELSSVARGHREELSLLASGIASLDTLHARARYSLLHNCFPAAVVGAEAKDRRLSLTQARHPLLGKDVVPIDVTLDGDNRLLLITGPNTGGKTVSLKTVGLLALMNQFGLEIPVAQGSRLPIFDNIFADIGDEQSIEQSLSTFSGHMKNIASIVSNATNRSLVLLDELGSGTDPEEGSALGMAILDYLGDKGAFVLVTSHHGMLKHFAYTRTGIANASVDFDVKNLKPTYRLLMGIPGSSHAIEIARRTRIPKQIVERAHEFLDEEQSDATSMIKKLNEAQREVVKEKSTLSEERERFLREQARLEELATRVEQREKELRAEKMRELDRFMSRARSRVENLVRELQEAQREQRALSKEETRGAKKLLEELEAEQREIAEQASEPLIPSEAGSRPAAREGGETGARGRAGEEISPGDEVLVGEHRRRGTVERVEPDGRLLVRVGAIRMTFDAGAVEPAAASNTEGGPRISVETSSDRSVSFELDLRGLSLEEALRRVEEQIDTALVKSVSRFGIIHGKGVGVLQKGIHGLLEEHQAVAEFEFARPEDGGTGKTYVVLAS
jgi:DNA mismatch repair protein MutS2